MPGALAVVAHPDDESFGLGAVLATLDDVRVVCLTHGEASTLGAVDGLGALRARELAAAAQVLGIGDVRLYDLPDGGLADADADELDGIVDRHAAGADLLVVFERQGVTGHPDHRAATAAALRVAARHGVPVLEWGVRPDVAEALNNEFGTSFSGLDGDDMAVDRARQLRAIECHASQARDNPVLRRRLELSGPTERVLRAH